MKPDVGRKVIEIARGLIGSHYMHGAYGATPGQNDGCPCLPGGVCLVATPNRLNPTRLAAANQNLAVYAAEMTSNRYCVCGGNYKLVSGTKTPTPTDPDLVAYLDSLKGRPAAAWPKPPRNSVTPRRAFGPGPGGDLGGKLVWGESCEGVRHFDCIGFISYCYWKATGNVVRLEISGWRGPAAGGSVFDLKAGARPAALMEGDILIKADHHIAFVDAQGAIFEAQDTDVGVRSTGRFSIAAPGGWTHLVRLAGGSLLAEPEWPLGWWKVWDGNTYYYHFSADGVVKSTRTYPSVRNSGPKQPLNTGRFSVGPSQVVVTWKKRPGVPTACVETFYNATAGCRQMNAKSNLYSPLVATRLE